MVWFGTPNGFVSYGFLCSTAALPRSTQKGRGEMVARDVPVDCGGVPVHPQDWIFGDADGVVVIPSSIAVDVLSVALRKINDEDATRNELLEGRSLSDVFERHGVL